MLSLEITILLDCLATEQPPQETSFLCLSGMRIVGRHHLTHFLNGFRQIKLRPVLMSHLLPHPQPPASSRASSLICTAGSGQDGAPGTLPPEDTAAEPSLTSSDRISHSCLGLLGVFIHILNAHHSLIFTITDDVCS